MGPRKMAVVAIDIQKEYLTKGRPLFVQEGQSVLAKATEIMDAARGKGISVVHVKHVSKNLSDSTFNRNSPLVELAYEVPAQEPVVTKQVPGAFYSTDLDDLLKSRGIEVVAVLGLLSFMCCDTTAREAHARGYKVLFVEDATAAIPVNGIDAKTVHNVVCAVQGWMFSQVVTTPELIALINKGGYA